MGAVEVIHADCRQVLDALPDGAVDAVIADPPYGVSHASCRTRGGVGASWKGTTIPGDRDTALRDWIVRWAEGRNLPWAVFGTWRRPRPPQARGVLVWDKGPAAGMGDLSFPWKPSWEEIYVGGPGWSGKRTEAVLSGHRVISWESRGRLHPHEKPVSLIALLLEKLPGVTTVLDPCAGSGSTALACLRAGKRCIAVEVDARYVSVIRRRVAEAATPLFAGAGPAGHDSSGRTEPQHPCVPPSSPSRHSPSPESS